MPHPFSSLTDFQPYILPHTDDWALPNDKATSLLNFLSTKGISQLYCIPPVRLENQNNSISFLQNTFLSFLKKNTSSCKLKLSARYRLDDGFIPLLEHDDLLPIDKSLIIDVSPLQEHKDTWMMIKKMISSGYTPILIQPERTTYWKHEDFIRLKEIGVKLMLNLHSLFGYHGDYALMYSEWMLSEGMYDYICSGMEDTKTMRYSENFTLDENDITIKELNRLKENGRLLWLTE